MQAVKGVVAKLQGASLLACAKPLPEALGDEILHFYPHPQREKLGGFWVANFLSYFPKEKWLKIWALPKLPKFSPHFPRQVKKFITWNSLWGGTSCNASFCRKMRGRKVTGRQLSVPIFH